jgi:hypothetical protein
MHLTSAPPWLESSMAKATETLRRVAAEFGLLDVQHYIHHLLAVARLDLDQTLSGTARPH